MKLYYVKFEQLWMFMKKIFVIFYVFLFSFLTLFANSTDKQFKEYYHSKDYSYLLNIDDFDKSLMKMHITLYEGYVKNVNMFINQMNNLNSSSNISKALKKTFAFEFDGLKLHELYFDNLKNHIKIDKKSKFFQKIKKQFKSFNSWIDDFKNTGLIRGIGWVILYYDSKEDKMFNTWIDEPQIAANKNEVFISRIRQDLSNEKAIDMWVCADQILKGASLNAFQILEMLIKKK